MDKLYNIDVNVELRMINIFSSEESIRNLSSVINYLFIGDLPFILKGIKNNESFSFDKGMCHLGLINNIVYATIYYEDTVINYEFERDLFINVGIDYYKTYMQYRDVLLPSVYKDMEDESKTL